MIFKNNNKNLLQKSTNALIWGSFCVLILLFLFIAYNNRLVQGDDMFFFSEMQEKGIIQPLIDFKYNTRFSSFLLFNLFFYFADGFSNTPTIIFIYHSLFLLALAVSIYLFIKEVITRLFNERIDKSHVIQLSGLFLIILFFGAPQLIETWFWVLASTVYGVPLIATLFGFYALLNKSKGTANYFVLIVSFLIVGGALETLALVNLLLLGLIIILSFNWDYFKPIRGKAIIACLSIIFLFSVNFINGGNSNRVASESSASTCLSNGLSDFVFSFFDPNNILVGICLLLILIKGKQLSSMGYRIRTSFNKRHYLFGFLLLSIIGIITLAPLIFVFEGWGPERAWIPFHFFVYITALILLLHIGNQSKLLSQVKLKITRFVLSGMLITLLLIIFYKQFPQIREHRIVYDAQIEKIENEIKNNRVVALEIETSPPSGYVVVFTLTSDTTHWYNLMMRRALKTNFSVYMSDSTSNEL